MSKENYVAKDWSRLVKAGGDAHDFKTLQLARDEAARINKLANALFEALKEQYPSVKEKTVQAISDNLFKKYGQGYKGDFSALEGNGVNEDETEITTGTDGLFYDLVYAPKHGNDSSHRKHLNWDQAKQVFEAVNRKAELTGDARWVAPELQTDAEIENLKPTNQPGGYDLPTAADPGAANVPNPAHKVAANYERILAYQIHQGGGQFGASQIVIWWGDTIGSNGSADAISIYVSNDPSNDPNHGRVTLWDSKAYAQGGKAIQSKTFTKEERQRTAVLHASRMIDAFAWKPEHLVPGGLKDRALASLADPTRNYKMITVRYKAVAENFVPLHLEPTQIPPPTGP
jgi:hypothetical protein